VTLGAEGGRRGGRFAARVVCVCGGGGARVVSTAWRHVLRNSLTNWRVWRRRPVWKMLSLVFVRVSRVRVAVRVNFRPSFAPIYVKRRLEHLVSFGPGLWAINLVLTSTWRPQFLPRLGLVSKIRSRLTYH